MARIRSRKNMAVWVFRSGQALAASATDEVLRQIREEREVANLGKRSEGFRYVGAGIGVLRRSHPSSSQLGSFFENQRLWATAWLKYSTLTRMPGKHRISGDQAMLFVGSIRERLSIIALNGDEYADALAESAARGDHGRRYLRRHACSLRYEGQSGNHL